MSVATVERPHEIDAFTTHSKE
ncbi:hypothetical protein FRACA_4330003 [Frankia canadensis]|uniref:Uncharacterized protein n=1 Tax=Frankia canadensis TaxID=1836972 RepID=A0A2I2KXA4_9ACTN|nr:hypothetical protein FRACA_4330003 [Frankia canadensis]SOU57580.1 hypothetical protein FRACA_4330003 [Frankia canadensis]